MITVTDLTTLANPEYLFEFIEEQTLDKVYAILSDTSVAPTRYNEFTITDGVDLTFPIDGYYTYNVYEQPSGTGTTDPTGLNLVERGRAHVYIVDSPANEYTSTEDNNVYE